MLVAGRSVGGSKRAPSSTERVLKRAIDIGIALIALVALSPILLLIAMLVRSCIGGTVFSAQRYIGRLGKPFDRYKFRTGLTGSEGLLGRMLRRSALDELPQLFNVVLGHMSCVGPRPISLEDFEMHGPHVVDDLDDVGVRPGLRGAWRDSGRG